MLGIEIGDALHIDIFSVESLRGSNQGNERDLGNLGRAVSDTDCQQQKHDAQLGH